MNPSDSTVSAEVAKSQTADIEQQLKMLKTVMDKAEEVIKSLDEEIGRIKSNFDNVKVHISDLSKSEEGHVEEGNIRGAADDKAVVKDGAATREPEDIDPAVNQKTEEASSEEKKLTGNNVVDSGVGEEQADQQKVEEPTDNGVAANGLN